MLFISSTSSRVILNGPLKYSAQNDTGNYKYVLYWIYKTYSAATPLNWLYVPAGQVITYILWLDWIDSSCNAMCD